MNNPTTYLISGIVCALAYTGPVLWAQERELRFDTKAAMYAANEEWLTFACEMPDGQVNIGSAKSMEMYYYSMYGLGNLLFRSGMGIHIVHNPLFTKHVMEDEGMPWYDREDGNRIFFQHKLAQFVKRTAADAAQAQFPPEGVFPIYLEYSSGVPTFLTEPQLSDFNTLRWAPESMDRTLNPGAWGQSMMKEVLWARDFFTHHKEIDGITYLGNAKDDGGNGFRGAALVALAITKSFALKSELAYDAKTRTLGGVDPKTYNPADGPIYYPHVYEAAFVSHAKPPKPESFTVIDESSDLFDVASLLWAESEFYFLTDPTIEDDYDLVFGDPKWNPRADKQELERQFRIGKTIFPLAPHQLSKGIAAVNFKNLQGLHFSGDHGTLVDTWHPDEGQGKRISTTNAGMAIVALANTYHRMHDVPSLRQGAQKLLTSQADFLAGQQRRNGSVADAYELTGRGVRGSSGPKSLLAQTLAIRGWLAAYHVTNDPSYRKAAERAHRFMQRSLWSDEAGVYRSHVGAEVSTYEGLNFGATIGALRELAIIAEGEDRRRIVARLDQFFEGVAQTNGLQLAELGRTGEMIPSLAKQQEMKVKLHRLMAEDPVKAKQMKAEMADSDGDGVPKPIFVAGTQFGAAPVQAASITLRTP